MKIWKRNAVVMTVVLFVCVALYLSWSYNREDMVDPLEAYLDEALLLDGVSAGAADDSLKDLDFSVPINVNDASDMEPSGDEVNVRSETPGSDHFSQTRLDRQRARDTAREYLTKVADLKESDQAVRDKAAADIVGLANAAMSEAKIEGLIMAKGFADCVAYLSADSIEILVTTPEGGLLASDVAKIRDIVINETKLPVDGILIFPVEV